MFITSESRLTSTVQCHIIVNEYFLFCPSEQLTNGSLATYLSSTIPSECGILLAVNQRFAFLRHGWTAEDGVGGEWDQPIQVAAHCGSRKSSPRLPRSSTLEQCLSLLHLRNMVARGISLRAPSRALSANAAHTAADISPRYTHAPLS